MHNGAVLHPLCLINLAHRITFLLMATTKGKLKWFKSGQDLNCSSVEWSCLVVMTTTPLLSRENSREEFSIKRIDLKNNVSAIWKVK